MKESREVLQEMLAGHMERLMREVRSLSPAQWSEIELTMPQARTLVFLSHGIKRMNELSTYLNCSMSSATSMVDRLVKKGMVERADDSSDRRVVVSNLTTAGRDVVERFLRMGRMKYEALADLLTREELEAAISTLEMLSAAAKRHRDSAVSEMEKTELTAAQLN